MLIDWSQNSAAKTTVAPYSLRGRFTPMVAAPRSWDEFDDPAAVEQVRFEEVLDRVDDFGDLLEPLAEAVGGTASAPEPGAGSESPSRPEVGRGPGSRARPTGGLPVQTGCEAHERTRARRNRERAGTN